MIARFHLFDCAGLRLWHAPVHPLLTWRIGIGNRSRRSVSPFDAVSRRPGYIADDRLAAFADRYMLDGDLLLATGAVAL